MADPKAPPVEIDPDIVADANTRRPGYLRALFRDAQGVDPGQAYMFALNNQMVDTPLGQPQRYSEAKWTVAAIPSGKVPS